MNVPKELNLETEFVHGGLTFVAIFDADRMQVSNIRIRTWDNDEVEPPSPALWLDAEAAAEHFLVDRAARVVAQPLESYPIPAFLRSGRP